MNKTTEAVEKYLTNSEYRERDLKLIFEKYLKMESILKRNSTACGNAEHKTCEACKQNMEAALSFDLLKNE